MGTEKAKPQKPTGTIKLAGEKIKIGEIEPSREASREQTKKAVDLLSKKRIFSPPCYLND